MRTIHELLRLDILAFSQITHGERSRLLRYEARQIKREAFLERQQHLAEVHELRDARRVRQDAANARHESAVKAAARIHRAA